MFDTIRARAISLSFPALMALTSFGMAASHSVQDDCGDKDMDAMKAWFPLDQIKDPGTTLPSSSLCAFHVWSTQMFLWLTTDDPDTGQMRLLGMSTLDELFAPTGMDKVARSETMMKLQPRVSKDGQPDLSEIMQAGSRGLLVDQTGNIVYYEQLFNDAFVSFTQNTFFSDGAFDPTKLAGATGLTEYFPAGVMELKASWKILTDAEKSAGTFKSIMAELYTLEVKDGKIVVSDQTEQHEVGLVGLHVAATVDKHPEMIWATFEHIGNAPNLPHGMSVDSDDAVSSNNFTFYKADTPANKGNINEGDTLVLKDGVVSPSTNVFRQFESGTTVGGKDWELNLADIAAVNEFWQGNIMPADSVLKNYFEVGSVWMEEGTLTPDQDPITQLRGSTILSNSTMETYTQADQQCFSCHNTLPVSEMVGGERKTLPGTNFNISHALVMEYFRALAQQDGVAVRAVR